MRRLLVTAVLLCAFPATAAAAEPDSGKVTAEAPTVSWTGHLERPYLTHVLFNYEPTAGTTGQLPCEAPTCDTFTLDAQGGGADLAITAVSDKTPDVSLRIQDPSGTWTYYDGWSDGAKPITAKYKKAAPGTYVVNVVGRYFHSGNPSGITDDTFDYKGTAALAVAPKPVVAPVSVAPPAAPAAKPAAPAAKPSARRKTSACVKKAKRIKNAKKRKAAIKRCAKKSKRR